MTDPMRVRHEDFKRDGDYLVHVLCGERQRILSAEEKQQFSSLADLDEWITEYKIWRMKHIRWMCRP